MRSQDLPADCASALPYQLDEAMNLKYGIPIKIVGFVVEAVITAQQRRIGCWAVTRAALIAAMM